MPPSIYCFSGLGADERLYAHIHVPPYTLKHIKWLPPDPGATLPQYAARLSCQIQETAPILMGVSFGGMIAIEVAKLLQARQTIIISSIQTAAHFPRYYHLANKIGLIPPRLLTTPNPVADYLFGTEQKEDKTLLHDFMRSSDSAFIKWALQAIINWKNVAMPQNLVHLHGTGDRIIPLPRQVHHKIQGGGHLMVYNRAAEVNKLLQLVLPTRH